MKIGCGEWGFRELPLEEHFQIAKRFGFRTLEFGIGGGQIGRLSAEPSREEIVSFKALSARYGIATPGCCLENDFTLLDPVAHQAMLATTIRQFSAAAACGARQVRLFAGFTPADAMTPALWDQMLSAFQIAQNRCAELGLSIAIETHGRITVQGGAAHHEHTVTTHPNALQRLLNALPAQIGINWDPGNLKAVAPEDRLCALPVLDQRITYCHLKDWRRYEGGWIACAIGDDDLDYEPLLRKTSYSGVFLIEYEPTHDPVDGIQRSLDYLRRLGMELELA